MRVAEHETLNRSKIAQSRSAIIKHVLAAAQRQRDLTSGEMLRDLAADAFVEHSVVAAVEGADPAEHRHVVERDDGESKPADEERQPHGLRTPLHQQQHDRQCGGEGQREVERLPEAHAPDRTTGSLTAARPGRSPRRRCAARRPAPESRGTARRLRPAGEGRRRRPAPTARRRSSTAGCRRYSAGRRNITKNGMSSRQGFSTGQPRDVLSSASPVGVPVVGHIVDRAEAQPRRIGKPDAAHAAGIGRRVEQPVGRERIGLARAFHLRPALRERAAAASRPDSEPRNARP